MAWKVLIVDDEAAARELLAELINNYCKTLDIVGQVASVKEALNAVEQTAPDLVFLDVEMPEANGFELLKLVPNPTFEVIFTTAYNQYAVQAIRFSALDFLQKPLSAEELISAVSRFESSRAEAATNELQKISVLLNNVREEKGVDKLVVPEPSGFTVVNVNDILYLQSEKSYTDIILQNEGRITSSKPIRHYEELLPKASFYRISQSFIVKLEAIKRYRKGEGGVIELTNGFEIDVPRRKKQEFLKFFQ